MINFTDVEDKMLEEAVLEGRKPQTIAVEVEKRFLHEAHLLGIRLPRTIAKASASVPQAVKLIQRLLTEGPGLLEWRGRLLRAAEVQAVRQALPPGPQPLAQVHGAFPEGHLQWAAVEPGGLRALARVQERRPERLGHGHRPGTPLVEHPGPGHDHGAPRLPGGHQLRRDRQHLPAPRLQHRNIREPFGQELRQLLPARRPPDRGRQAHVQEPGEHPLPGGVAGRRPGCPAPALLPGVQALPPPPQPDSREPQNRPPPAWTPCVP